MHQDICRAIRELRLIQLRYDWGYRTVEPHAFGRNNKGNELLRVYQVGGTSKSGETTGWKLFRLDEINALCVLEEQFPGPRSGYKTADKALSGQIYCEL